MRVILQMFGFRFHSEESLSPLPNWFLPGVLTCVNRPDSLSVPVPLSLHVPLSVDRHAVCPTDSRRSAICICKSVSVCVYVCVWSGPACAQFTYPSFPLWIIFPVCLMSTWLSSPSVKRHRKCLRLPGYIHHKLSPDLSVGLPACIHCKPLPLVPYSLSLFICSAFQLFVYNQPQEMTCLPAWLNVYSVSQLTPDFIVWTIQILSGAG